MSERMSGAEFNVAAKLILKVPCGYRERFVAEARRARESEEKLREALRAIAEESCFDKKPDPDSCIICLARAALEEKK